MGDKSIGRGAFAALVAACSPGVAAMLQVPSSLAGLLSLLRGCFTQPSFETFSMLVVGSVGRARDCTVTGMLQAAGLAGSWHHSRAHDFFARARWEPDAVGLALVDFLVVVFVKSGASIRLAVDDTLFGRSGRKVFGAHYLHDGAQPEGSGQRTRWGNCWVVLVVELPCLDGRPVGLPILFRLFRPKDEEHPDRRSQPELARGLIDMILKRFPGRIVRVGDGRRVRQQGVARTPRARHAHDQDALKRRRVRARATTNRQAGTPTAEGRPATEPRHARRRRDVPCGHGHDPGVDASGPRMFTRSRACGTGRCTRGRCR